ncbi:MAG: RDD family protein [Phycisphaerae bacterium]|nr:RDD family protein [Phycisphaerae bacterium]
MNLRVVDEHGLQMTFGQIVVRNLMRGVDCLPMFYLVGGAACVLSRRSQRLGDVAAGTVVVRSVDVALPDLAGVSSDKDKYNSFTKYPHIEARLRQRIAPDEARIALQALLRRNSLDPDRRIELFSELAGHFRAMLDFPPEATDGLSDEKYIRNIVDTLFRSQLKA